MTVPRRTATTTTTAATTTPSTTEPTAASAAAFSPTAAAAEEDNKGVGSAAAATTTTTTTRATSATTTATAAAAGGANNGGSSSRPPSSSSSASRSKRTKIIHSSSSGVEIVEKYGRDGDNGNKNNKGNNDRKKKKSGGNGGGGTTKLTYDEFDDDDDDHPRNKMSHTLTNRNHTGDTHPATTFDDECEYEYDRGDHQQYDDDDDGGNRGPTTPATSSNKEARFSIGSSGISVIQPVVEAEVEVIDHSPSPSPSPPPPEDGVVETNSSSSSNSNSSDDDDDSSSRKGGGGKRRRRQQELQDAVAASIALVGENIFDSPTGGRSSSSSKNRGRNNKRRTRKVQVQDGTAVVLPNLSLLDNDNDNGGEGEDDSSGNGNSRSSRSLGYCGSGNRKQQREQSSSASSTQQHTSAGSTAHQQRLPSPSSGRKSGGSRSAPTSPAQRQQQQQQQQQKLPRQQPSSSSRVRVDDTLSVGMMANGLAWVQRQRDRRRRMYLQNQAEQQLEKLRQAQMAEKVARQQQQQSHGGGSDCDEGDSTFQSLAKAMRSFSVTPGDDDEGGGRGGRIGEGGEKARSCTTKFAATAAAAAAADTAVSTTDGDVSRTNSYDDEGEPVISQTGDGFSVNLPVPDSPVESAAEDGDDPDASWVPPVRILPDPPHAENTEPPPYILTPDQLQQVAVNVLPRGIAYCQWKRLYSLARDGDSFDACLRLVGGESKTLLVVRTSKNAAFGGFADMPWDLYNGVYFGGPTACLFRVDENGRVVTYKWSGANRYIQLVDHQRTMLAFGGGEDESSGSGAHFGLSVEQDFQVGSTGPCATFHNEPLCDQETFEIIDLEIFGFLIGQF